MMKRKRMAVISLLFLALLVLAAATLGATTAGFDPIWWTAESGGRASGTGPAGLFEMSGTLGQPDAGYVSGGAFELASGFWGRGVARQAVYLPVILRQQP